jgi:hypothetical protein
MLDSARAAALNDAIDLAGPAPMAGGELPPFWQYAYFFGVAALFRVGF